MTNQNDILRGTFDNVAGLYHEMRPTYPDALFDDIVLLSQIPDGGHILEIGSGTGQATLPLAQRGYAIQCVELGADLADLARRNLGEYPNVHIANTDFESYPVNEGYYDLFISANAFHWIDPAIRYHKAYTALKPGGALALFWNVHITTEISAGFQSAVEEVYEQFTPDKDNPPPAPASVEEAIIKDRQGIDEKTKIDETDLFGEVIMRRHPFTVDYTAGEYVKLLNTYSDHRVLEVETRARLFEGIANLIDNYFGGRVTKEYVALLYFALRD